MIGGWVVDWDMCGLFAFLFEVCSVCILSTLLEFRSDGNEECFSQKISDEIRSSKNICQVTLSLRRRTLSDPGHSLGFPHPMSPAPGQPAWSVADRLSFVDTSD